jgi:aminoglycoside 6'-N-acetyltransferase I
MQIIDLRPNDEYAVHQAASQLVEGFKSHWPSAWPDMESARQEVREALEPGKICRVAVDDHGTVLGWIGGFSGYGGRVWELHPLVVAPAHQGQGIGRALVADLERLVRDRGGLTLQLGSDDVDNMTTLGGVDLYPNVLEYLAALRNLRRHPYEFYQKLGFAVVGVVPDANGFGKPDILMAKRVGR